MYVCTAVTRRFCLFYPITLLLPSSTPRLPRPYDPSSRNFIVSTPLERLLRLTSGRTIFYSLTEGVVSSSEPHPVRTTPVLWRSSKTCRLPSSGPSPENPVSSLNSNKTCVSLFGNLPKLPSYDTTDVKPFPVRLTKLPFLRHPYAVAFRGLIDVSITLKGSLGTTTEPDVTSTPSTSLYQPSYHIHLPSRLS